MLVQCAIFLLKREKRRTPFSFAPLNLYYTTSRSINCFLLSSPLSPSFIYQCCIVVVHRSKLLSVLCVCVYIIKLISVNSAIHSPDIHIHINVFTVCVCVSRHKNTSNAHIFIFICFYLFNFYLKKCLKSQKICHNVCVYVIESVMMGLRLIIFFIISSIHFATLG